ncbi:peroxiredoxin family protein [Thermodesulfobacteriota bacterium]
MSHRSKSITSIIVFMIIFLLFPGSISIRDVKAQQMAPYFTLPDLSGNMVSLKDFRGKIVFVDFWATWCLPCRKSLPELAKLDKKYRDKGLVILGLSMDNPDSFDNKYVSEFIKDFKVEYQILRADKKVVENYLGTEGVSIPALIIVDSKGKIVEKQVGFDPGIAEKALRKLLENEQSRTFGNLLLNKSP